MKFTAPAAFARATLVCAALVIASPGAAQDEEPQTVLAFPPVAQLGAGPWDYASEAGPIHVELVTGELDRPWGIAFLPDGAMLVTERPGRLRVIRDGVLEPEPISGLPEDIYAFGIGGLKSIVLHPDFANNQLIYISYSKVDPADRLNSTLAVARARWDGGASLADLKEIFIADAWYGKQPLPEKCCGQGPAFGSYGGRIAFGADGKLYIASGDRNYGEMVQDPSNHFGKILRLNDDGSVPGDNPHVGEAGWKPEIWTTGHRNPTGLTLDSETGDLWSSEFGPRGGDEINKITRGANYGWIDVTQGFHYDGTPAKGLAHVEGMTDPVAVFGPPSFNPGNLAVYRGAMFERWQGNLLVASMSRSLTRISINHAGNVSGQEKLLGDLRQRLRDASVAPDGSVYILTDETRGAVLRITPGA